jgi:hypothetical protein
MFHLSRHRRRNFSELRTLSELNEISRGNEFFIRDIFGWGIGPFAFPGSNPKAEGGWR